MTRATVVVGWAAASRALPARTAGGGAGGGAGAAGGGQRAGGGTAGPVAEAVLAPAGADKAAWLAAGEAALLVAHKADLAVADEVGRRRPPGRAERAAVPAAAVLQVLEAAEALQVAAGAVRAAA